MVLSNRLAILILGFLVGGLLNFGRIGAEAYLLATFEPIHAVYVATVGSMLFSFVLPRVDWEQSKFSKLALWVTLGFAALVLALVVTSPGHSTQALVWYLLIILSTAFHRWMCGEVLLRHLNPAVAQSYFAYLGTSYEIGTVVVIVASKVYPGDLGPNETMLCLVLMYLMVSGLLLLQFVPTRNLEVRYQTGEDMGFDRDEPASFDKFKGFYIFFGMLVICLGAAKVSESYLVSVVLKEELSSYAAIRGVMADYYLVASFFVILITIGIGRQVQRTHTSPIRLIIFYIASVLTVALVATWTDVFYAFLALAIVRRVAENSLLNPSVQMVITSFAGKLRTKLRSAHSIFYYSAVGVPLAMLYSYTSAALESERFLLGSIIITLLTIALVLLMGFEKRLVAALYQFVYEGNKTSAVGAVQALSFLKPPQYSEHMGELLSAEPKQVLRKTIIMGLGHVSHDDQTTETILHQFKSDKEEIQIAVLDALKLSNRYEAIQFLAKIMMAKEMSHSLKVRMNAAQMIASLYGRKAIPFLLNGLEDEDERVVANTLEVLSVFKDKNLARYFREFVEWPVPRVRANALMGLAHYRQDRELYEGITREILDGYDTQMLVSVLYVVGSLRDKTFMKHLDKLMTSQLAEDPMVRRGLAWAFTRLEDERGFELFAQLFGAPWDGKEEPFMHFVSQLSRHLRFDLVKYIAIRYYDDTDVIIALNEKLEVSHFDFHEEIQYLEILLDTIGESRRASKQGLKGLLS
ncbi:MAG: hypothetical protein HOI23_21630 [Deltaproteobacteria bacterium]|jgi:hypothetical protein|nr:hypothetical protein [Deltaproteobacteria bacterium]MBT6432266.1 hypothetical protein [Deltaproteobacteria bacterium]